MSGEADSRAEQQATGAANDEIGSLVGGFGAERQELK